MAASQATFRADGTLTMEGRVGHAVLPTGAGSETFLFVDVASPSGQTALTPAPLELAIVIDRSGSMRGKRLRNALAAARTAIDRLRTGDRVSVISYDTRTSTVVPTTTITPSSRGRVRAALGSIRAGGDTCISCGLDAAMQRLQREPGRVSRVLLLSDGEATAGVRSEAGFRQIAESCRAMGASITSIGVDVDYNERIMATVARSSNGRHFFVEDAAALAGIFDQEMERLLRVVATDAEVAIDLAPGVVVQEVYDRGFQRVGLGRVVVPLGAFSDSERKTVLMRLRVPGGASGARPLANVGLGYSDLVTQRPTRSEGHLAIELTSDAGKLAPLDALVSARLGQSEVVQALERANQLVQRGDASGAQVLLDERRQVLAERRSRASKAAPRGRAGGLERDFDKLDGILGAASSGFAQPPPAADAEGGGGGGLRSRRPARSKREVKAQIRSNQADAVELGF
ncbi:MAG: VWA domain-containing protein [Haliangiales bacterium]